MGERWLDRQVSVEVGGEHVAGTVVTERWPAGSSAPVLGVQLPGGQVETWVPDLPRQQAIEPRALARAVLAGREVRLPIAQQMQVLAAAVLAGGDCQGGE